MPDFDEALRSVDLCITKYITWPSYLKSLPQFLQTIPKHSSLKKQYLSLSVWQQIQSKSINVSENQNTALYFSTWLSELSMCRFFIVSCFHVVN